MTDATRSLFDASMEPSLISEGNGAAALYTYNETSLQWSPR